MDVAAGHALLSIIIHRNAAADGVPPVPFAVGLASPCCPCADDHDPESVARHVVVGTVDLHFIDGRSPVGFGNLHDFPWIEVGRAVGRNILPWLRTAFVAPEDVESCTS